MIHDLCKRVLRDGGALVPLLIPSVKTGGTGLMNPSIISFGGELIVNIRHVNYVLHHSEGSQFFQNRWGPLAYLNPENDVKLKTTNWICKIDTETLQVEEEYKVDTTKLDIPPKWDFHGLEDARLIKWKGKLYLSGVRRDVKDNGEGRIELSEVTFSADGIKEVKRIRIPAVNEESYCEKNWMPIEDMPYSYIKWTMPTELVTYNPTTKKISSEMKNNAKFDFVEGDLRGGSQVIRYGTYYIAIVHEVRLSHNKLGQKDAKYMHRFVMWNLDWEIYHISNLFSFLNADIEFACGMTLYKDGLFITFGFQDNAAYVLRIPNNHIIKYLLC